jgi:hypothetical protein
MEKFSKAHRYDLILDYIGMRDHIGNTTYDMVAANLEKY